MFYNKIFRFAIIIQKNIFSYINKIQKNIKNHIFILVIVALIIIHGLSSDFEILDTNFYNSKIPSPILKRGTNVVQKFLVRGNLKKISIKFGNYDMKLKGYISLKILDSHNKNFAECKCSAKKIINNKFYDFFFKGKVKKGKYKLQIKYFPESNNEKLSVWMTEKNKYRWGNLYIDNKKYSGDIVFRVFYEANLVEGVSVFFERFHLFKKNVIFVILIIYLIVFFMLIFIYIRKILNV